MSRPCHMPDIPSRWCDFDGRWHTPQRSCRSNQSTNISHITAEGVHFAVMGKTTRILLKPKTQREDVQSIVLRIMELLMYGQREEGKLGTSTVVAKPQS